MSATTHARGDHVEIHIRDNGIGIPSEVKEKIFNPFFTTKPAGEGTGLGLSMSHDIVVKQHGGRIDVDSEPGAFTEFIVTLPRKRTCAPAGQISFFCPALLAKIFRFHRRANHLYKLAHPGPQEGRIMIVTVVGMGCDGRGSVGRAGHCRAGFGL